MTLDLEYINSELPVFVNDEPYEGKLSVGDTLTILTTHYAVLGINEDGIVVKEIK